MRIPRRLLLGLALAASLAIVPSTASAAHCVSPDGTSPGFSYFGTVHVKGDAHANEGGNPGPHAGTPGASNCRDTSGSPAGRSSDLWNTSIWIQCFFHEERSWRRILPRG